MKVNDLQYTPEVFQLCSKLLIRNPEYYTIWNDRRRILQHQISSAKASQMTIIQVLEAEPKSVSNESILNMISSDLNFVFSLLRKFPKCYWIWNHRRWLLQQASVHLLVSETRDLWKSELVLVSKMLALDNRNFHGWGYRRRVVAALESEELNIDGLSKSMAKEEFDYTTRMIGASMSNFSAWHNRSKLIPRMLDETGAIDADRRKVLNEGMAVPPSSNNQKELTRV